jgi:hypothetical protein
MYGIAKGIDGSPKLFPKAFSTVDFHLTPPGFGESFQEKCLFSQL